MGWYSKRGRSSSRANFFLCVKQFPNIEVNDLPWMFFMETSVGSFFLILEVSVGILWMTFRESLGSKSVFVSIRIDTFTTFILKFAKTLWHWVNNLFIKTPLEPLNEIGHSKVKNLSNFQGENSQASGVSEFRGLHVEQDSEHFLLNWSKWIQLAKQHNHNNHNSIILEG